MASIDAAIRRRCGTGERSPRPRETRRIGAPPRHRADTPRTRSWDVRRVRSSDELVRGGVVDAVEAAGASVLNNVRVTAAEDAAPDIADRTRCQVCLGAVEHGRTREAPEISPVHIFRRMASGQRHHGNKHQTRRQKTPAPRTRPTNLRRHALTMVDRPGLRCKAGRRDVQSSNPGCHGS